MKTLFHYSNKNISDKIKVKYFCNNHFTLNEKNVSSIKRSFFYTIKNPQEYLLEGCQYLYICKVKKSTIYDITKDNQGLYKGNITKLLKKVKQLKYQGIKYTLGGYEVVSLLYDIPIYKTIKRGV